METIFICYDIHSLHSTQHKSNAWANRSTLNIMAGGAQNTLNP
jgi:hypothetical protein